MGTFAERTVLLIVTPAAEMAVTIIHLLTSFHSCRVKELAVEIGTGNKAIRQNNTFDSFKKCFQNVDFKRRKIYSFVPRKIKD